MSSSKVFQPQHIVTSLGGQIVKLPRRGDVLPPAGHLLVYRDGAGDIALRHRHLVGALAVDGVADTDRHGLQAGEHIEFGQEVVGDPVDPGGVAGDHGVKPAAAPRATGRHADLPAGLAQVGAVLVEQLGRERTGSDPGGVSLQDAEHGGDPGGSDTGSDGRPAGGGVGRGHVRVGAVVDVEQGALRALQQNGLASLQRLAQQQPGVGNAVGESLRLDKQRLGYLVYVQCLPVVDLHQHLVLELQRGADLGGQELRVEYISHPDTDTGDLVLIAGPDTAAGGADLLVPEIALGDLVDGDVVGHQQMRVRGDQQLRGVDTAVLEPAQLGQQHPGIDDDAVADDVGDPGREDARRDEVQGEVLPVGQYDGMSGVVAALVAHNPLNPATEKIGGLTFALVAPLGADEDDCRHGVTPLHSWLSVSSRCATLSERAIWRAVDE